MKTSLIAVACCLAFTGCTLQERTGPIMTAPPVAAPLAYTIVAPVESTGTASRFCPSVWGLGLIIQDAAEQAVGKAIYERDDIDIVLNPKKKISVTSYLVWATATVTIKGRGAAFANR